MKTAKKGEECKPAGQHCCPVMDTVLYSCENPYGCYCCMHSFLHSMKLKFLLSLTLPALQSSSRAGEQTIYPLASSGGLVLGLEASGVRETSLLPTVTNSASQTNPREMLLAWSAAVGAPFPVQLHMRNSPQAPLPLPSYLPRTNSMCRLISRSVSPRVQPNVSGSAGNAN